MSQFNPNTIDFKVKEFGIQNQNQHQEEPSSNLPKYNQFSAVNAIKHKVT